MKKTAASLSILAIICGFAKAATQAEVQCTDGSRLKGSLLEIDAEQARLDAEFLASPVPLKIEHILEIGLPTKRGKFEGDHIATVTLSNGDTLRGKLTGVTDKEISLHTWYAGDMKFRREMVDSLEIEDLPELLYAGPGGPEGWVQDDPESWTFDQASLKSQGPGTIARNIGKLPSRVRYAFDLAWRSNPRFRFIFQSDDETAAEPSNCYILSFTNARYVQLSKRSSRSGLEQIGTFSNIPELQSKEKIRLELLVDRKTGLIRLLVNGNVAADWTDPTPDPGSGPGAFHFNSQDPSPIRISRLEVTTWDGILEGSAPNDEEGPGEDDEAPPAADEPELDPARIRLRNNDQVAGEMLGIEDGKVKLRTRFGEVLLPVSRLRTFTLHTKEERKNPDLYQIQKRYLGDVRAWFPDGSRVTFRLAGAGDGNLKGYAQPFGDATFGIDAFNRIEFNLYDPDLDGVRAKRDSF